MPLCTYAKATLSLPADQAFVVRVYADAEVDKGRFFGRVEQIVSGKVTHFDSCAALVAFIARVLAVQSARRDKEEPT